MSVAYHGFGWRLGAAWSVSLSIRWFDFGNAKSSWLLHRGSDPEYSMTFKVCERSAWLPGLQDDSAAQLWCRVSSWPACDFDSEWCKSGRRPLSPRCELVVFGGLESSGRLVSSVAWFFTNRPTFSFGFSFFYKLGQLYYIYIYMKL